MIRKFVKTLALLIVVVGVGISSVGLAVEKVAIVDLQKALNEVDEGKKAKAAIQADMDAKKKQLDVMKEEIKKMREDLEKQKAVLAKAALETKANAIQTKFLEFQQKAMQYDQELKQKEVASIQKILDALKLKVVALAKEKQYTIVYENSADIVLYSSTATDITGDLIQAYNK